VLWCVAWRIKAAQSFARVFQCLACSLQQCELLAHVGHSSNTMSPAHTACLCRCVWSTCAGTSHHKPHAGLDRKQSANSRTRANVNCRRLHVPQQHVSGQAFPQVSRQPALQPRQPGGTRGLRPVNRSMPLLIAQPRACASIQLLCRLPRPLLHTLCCWQCRNMASIARKVHAPTTSPPHKSCHHTEGSCLLPARAPALLLRCF
jgi:hypothetical protein